MKPKREPSESTPLWQLAEDDVQADLEPVEEIPVSDTATDTATDEQGNSAFEVEENVESADVSGIDETLTAPVENTSEENNSTLAETADSEPVEEISVPETAS